MAVQKCITRAWNMLAFSYHWNQNVSPSKDREILLFTSLPLALDFGFHYPRGRSATKKRNRRGYMLALELQRSWQVLAVWGFLGAFDLEKALPAQMM